MKTINNFPLSKVTTLGIGGPAKEFMVVKTDQELIDAIKYATEASLEYLIIGGGSNLLVSDAGVNKLVIKNEINGITSSVIPAKAGIQKTWIPDKFGDDKIMVSVKSGTPLQDLVNFANEHGLSGIQKLMGIPGSVGGAVYGNAGAYGQTISDCLTKVITINASVIPAEAGIQDSVESHGSRINSGMTKEECQFGYRDSIFKKNKVIILEIHFEFSPSDPKTLQAESAKILADREKKYPPGIKCPGSFFKNILAVNLSKEILEKIPEEKIPYGKVSVGYLLEEVGAKGDSLGNIEIAPYHANLFINKGGGTAKDFYDLAKKYYNLVKEKFGITLEPEVQLINLPPLN